MKDQIEGNVNEKLGQAKASVGSAVGDDQLTAEGKAQEAQGGLQKVAGEVKERVGDAVDAVKKAFDKNNA